MKLSRVTLDDLLGAFWVRSGVAVRWDSYYGTIDALRPLFMSSEFNEVISGFYINVAGGCDAARIKYFVSPENVEEGVELFRSYFQEKGIVEIYLDINEGNFNPTFAELRSRAEIINGIPFCSLEDVRRFKIEYNREKDIKDIELIENYLSKK